MFKYFKKRNNSGNNFSHAPGIKYSKELSDEESGFIKSMTGYRDTAQMPMLTDKICVLIGEIRSLNRSTTFFSIVLAFFALVQIIIVIIK